MARKRILIVEDEAVTVSALERDLVSLGYDVVGTANETHEAVALAQRVEPDLVLMDITLQGELDGVAAAVAIRGGTGAPVVFLTAHSDEQTMQRAMLAGPFGYLIKPFETNDLKAAIEVALHKRQSEIERSSI